MVPAHVFAHVFSSTKSRTCIRREEKSPEEKRAMDSTDVSRILFF